MSSSFPDDLVTLDADRRVWDRFFTVSPLVVVGTCEGEGYDLAPKHLAMPLSWENHFGFVCTPEHATYRNAREAGEFAVSYPRPTQAVVASLTASPRCGEDGEQPVLDSVRTFPARKVDAPLLADAYLYLECRLTRVVDGFGPNGLVAGEVVAAHVRDEALRNSEREDETVLRRASPLVYLAPGRYAELQETHAFPFPAGFHR